MIQIARYAPKRLAADGIAPAHTPDSAAYSRERCFCCPCLAISGAISLRMSSLINIPEFQVAM